MNSLSKYLSNGYTNKAGKMLKVFLPEAIVLNFSKILFEKQINEIEQEIHVIKEPNSKSDLLIRLYERCLSYKFNQAITLAVFGSIANNDSTTYSDFDGILIYDEKYFAKKKTISQLRSLVKEINLLSHYQDILQHHGIIIIGKNELVNRQDELTNQLIKESVIVYGNNCIELSYSKTNNYTNSFYKLKKSILSKLNMEKEWINQYFFKNMLSELLLLPCSYLQHKKQTYISKKDSFESIKTVFHHTEIETINHLETIRKNWFQKKLNTFDFDEQTISSLKKTQLTSKIDIEIMKSIRQNLIDLLETK